jgi:hypothetical protein
MVHSNQWQHASRHTSSSGMFDRAVIQCLKQISQIEL